MTTLLFHEVLVTRDANTIIPRQVASWELPVLQELYPDGAVQVTSDIHREFDLPDVEPEMARLARLYGSDEDTKTPFVEIAYGRSTIGMRQLQKAIQKSVMDEEGEAKRGPGRPKKQEAA